MEKVKNLHSTYRRVAPFSNMWHVTTTLYSKTAAGKPIDNRTKHTLARILEKSGWVCKCICGQEVIFDSVNVGIGYVTCPRCHSKLVGSMKRCFEGWLEK